MNKPKVFVDRRSGYDRRREHDPCRNVPFDLYHRKRRKCIDRRTQNRTLDEDYLAFFGRLPANNKAPDT